MITRRAALLAALLHVSGRAAIAQTAPLPSSSLDVRDSRGGWHELWRSANAPVTWSSATLLRDIRFQRGADGIEFGDVLLRGTSEAWRTRLIVVRIDPSQVSLALDTAFTHARIADWTLGRASPHAIFAVNAGQFEATIPWGWVVLNGRRWLPSQHGPLSAALSQDSAGVLHWHLGDEVQRAASAALPQWAFQSFPAVISGDSVLRPVRGANSGIDVAHRDARTGICLLHDGHLLVALTRFDAIGSTLDFVPFGLTVPEMTGVLGALGCRDAMLLDGGISARLRVRDARGVNHDWEGLRAVPLALTALPRQATRSTPFR